MVGERKVKAVTQGYLEVADTLKHEPHDQVAVAMANWTLKDWLVSGVGDMEAVEKLMEMKFRDRCMFIRSVIEEGEEEKVCKILKSDFVEVRSRI
jgi:hypothetical protein